ncbi:MAG: D-alanyl-D-alanine carboxypeptidase family protein, partial [Actinomycetota bacterium]
PKTAAARFARANGARLASCDCPPGGLEMEVEVVYQGAVARARAAIEPDKLGPLGFGSRARGLHPQLAWAVQQLTRASEGAVVVDSGWRSSERQEELWLDALAKYGDPEVADDWVARPGHSMHERGLAVDLGGDLDRAVALVDRLDLPLVRPMSWEPWHFELDPQR